MDYLELIPEEIFMLIIEHLVMVVGIQKAVLLRTVSHAFNRALIQAVCVSQVIKMEDPATPDLYMRIAPSLRAKIIMNRCRTTKTPLKGYLAAVSNANSELDRMICDTGNESRRRRHEYVASIVNPTRGEPINDEVRMHHLLSTAAAVGDHGAVETLLNPAAAGEFIDINGSTPWFDDALTLAAGAGHLHVVRYLLDNGARQEMGSCKGERSAKLRNQNDWDLCSRELHYFCLSRGCPSPLRAAILSNESDIVTLLLQQRYRLPSNSLEYLRAILSAVQVGRHDFLTKILGVIGKDCSDFIDLREEMLWRAARHQQFSMIKMLLAWGVDINSSPGPENGSHFGALHLAASFGYVRLAKYLLEEGANVNANGCVRPCSLPVEAAANCGQQEVLQILIEHGADAGKALRWGAESGQPRLVKYLLSKYPGLVTEDNGEVGQFALLASCSSGNLTSITALVEAGVALDPEFVDKSRFYVTMDWASHAGHTWVIPHLRALGLRGVTERDHSRTPYPTTQRRVRIYEHTWQWVGRY